MRVRFTVIARPTLHFWRPLVGGQGKSGANPARTRHCDRGEASARRARTERKPLARHEAGKARTRRPGSQETCLRPSRTKRPRGRGGACPIVPVFWLPESSPPSCCSRSRLRPSPRRHRCGSWATPRASTTHGGQHQRAGAARRLRGQQRGGGARQGGQRQLGPDGVRLDDPRRDAHLREQRLLELLDQRHVLAAGSLRLHRGARRSHPPLRPARQRVVRRDDLPADAVRCSGERRRRSALHRDGQRAADRRDDDDASSRSAARRWPEAAPAR